MRFLAIAAAALCLGQDDLRKVRESGTFVLTPGRGRCFHQRLLAGGTVGIDVEAKPDGGLDLYLVDSENFVRIVKGEKPQAVLAKEREVNGNLTLELPPGNWFLVLRGRPKEEGGTQIDGDDLTGIWLARKIGGPWGGLLAFIAAVEQKEKPEAAGTPARVRLGLSWSYSEEALKKAEVHEAEVKKNPGKFVAATAGGLSQSTLGYEGTFLDSLTVRNDSDLDLCVVKVKVAYFRNDKELGSRSLSFQGARLFPRKSQVTGGAKLKQGVPPSYAFSYDPGEARVFGKADRAEVTVLEVRPE